MVEEFRGTGQTPPQATDARGRSSTPPDHSAVAPGRRLRTPKACRRRWRCEDREWPPEAPARGTAKARAVQAQVRPAAVGGIRMAAHPRSAQQGQVLPAEPDRTSRKGAMWNQNGRRQRRKVRLGGVAAASGGLWEATPSQEVVGKIVGLADGARAARPPDRPHQEGDRFRAWRGTGQALDQRPRQQCGCHEVSQARHARDRWPGGGPRLPSERPR